MKISTCLQIFFILSIGSSLFVWAEPNTFVRSKPNPELENLKYKKVDEWKPGWLGFTHVPKAQSYSQSMSPGNITPELWNTWTQSGNSDLVWMGAGNQSIAHQNESSIQHLIFKDAKSSRLSRKEARENKKALFTPVTKILEPKKEL